jgi:hypothetical protein
MLLFEFAKRLGLDKCVRCGEQLTIDDFTIDHVKAWLDVNPALFWDLSNIGFSHASCNNEHQRRPGNNENLKRWSYAKNAPKGKAWCSKHEVYLPVKDFHRDVTRVSGYRNVCKKCFHAPVA